jgi:hypothetical protein
MASKGKRKKLDANPGPVPIRPSRILHEVIWNRSQDYGVIAIIDNIGCSLFSSRWETENRYKIYISRCVRFRNGVELP